MKKLIVLLVFLPCVLFAQLPNKFTIEEDFISIGTDFEIPNINFIKWDKSTEIQDLMRFDIGVMPLYNDKWAKGKCGFKALQYLSLGIPAIVSPIGVNVNIVDEGKNGFLCDTSDDWYNALYYFMSNVGHRDEMKKAAIQKVENEFSVKSNQNNFLSLILNKWN
jgi:glycosyltransferase involved in cell wall biosynthesis